MKETKVLNRFQVLDSFRGLAATLVAVGHYNLSYGAKGTFPNSYILAVDFFFALTGFVVFSSLNRSLDLSNWLRNFAVRRIFRIFPGYLLVSCAYIAFFSPLLGQENLLNTGMANILSLAMLLQGTGLYPSNLDGLGISPMLIGWALSIEVWVCLVFFMSVWILRRSYFKLIVCLIIAAWASLAVIVSYSPNYMDVHMMPLGPTQFGVMRGILGLSSGVLAFLLASRTSNMTLPSAWEAGILLLLVITYASPEYNRQGEFLIPLFAFAMLVIFSNQSGLISRILVLRPFQFLGTISFGIYMCHPLAMASLELAHAEFNKWNVVLMLLLTTAFATGLHFLIERPFIVWARKVTSSQ